MSHISPSHALMLFDDRFASSRVDADDFGAFRKQLERYLSAIEDAEKNNETEEHLKNLLNKFLVSTFYDNKYSINTKGAIDTAITKDNKVLAIFETKKSSNTNEMVSIKDVNKKALHELLYYYLDESRNTKSTKVTRKPNCEIRNLVITDCVNWFVFNANDIEKLCDGYLENHFYKYKNGQLNYANDNSKFYDDIKTHLDEIDVTDNIRFLFFSLRDSDNVKDLKDIYKVLSPYYLLKEQSEIKVKTHELNSKFYKELLYIMGLYERKEKGKIFIDINRTVKNTFADQLMNKYINDKDREEADAVDKTFELIIIWLNRLLFIKLFEGQLIAFNSDIKDYHILDNEKITSFDDLQLLFFNVLGKKERDDDKFYDRFSLIPYLNSSLFEKQSIEINDININELKNLMVEVKQGSVLGKKAPSRLPLLEYTFSFLNSYTFSSNDEENKNDIIDASVLGLIFEKINGYKDGSFYTPSKITEYIARKTLERAVVNKVNTVKNWKCRDIYDLKFQINIERSLTLRKEINSIINSITICDPAVGSGHFLVSALNVIVAIKAELGVLFYYNSDDLVTEFDVSVIDDVLIVTDGQGNEFKYNKNSSISQRLQETLFNEKRSIIEESLFGVDINNKAVYICQLRLWIELLKNAYYKNGIMETLPNIDINIKCGNSLIHKLKYKVGKPIATKSVTLSNSENKLIKSYKESVKRYKATSDKREKTDVKNSINRIRNELHSAYDQMQIKLDDTGMTVLSWQADDDVMFDIYQHAFEWAIEFPEILSEDGEFLGFDCLIGNPPYIRVQELNHRDIDYYKQSYSTAWKRLDISTLFIELANSLINTGGLISFISSNQFLSAEYGRRVRKFLVEKQLVYQIVDFVDLPVFDVAQTYVSIFFMENHNLADNEIMYYKVPELPFVVPVQEQFFNIKYSSLSEETWELEPQDIKNCLEQIRNASDTTLKTFANCWAGAITGCDNILMFDIDEKSPLEDEMLISVVRAEGCSRYGNAIPTKKIFYPYREIDGNTQLIPLNEIEHDYPLAYSYIMQNEEILKKRKDSRETFGSRAGWYGLIRFGTLSRFRQKKIVSPGEVRHNKFCIDETGSAFSCARVFSINLENDDIDILYLLAILNSKVSEFYLHKTSAVKAGGYYSYSSTAINALPIVVSEEYRQQIIDLSREIIEKQKNGIDTDEIEKALDEIVYNIYGLTESDKIIIEDALMD